MKRCIKLLLSFILILLLTFCGCSSHNPSVSEQVATHLQESVKTYRLPCKMEIYTYHDGKEEIYRIFETKIDFDNLTINNITDDYNGVDVYNNKHHTTSEQFNMSIQNNKIVAVSASNTNDFHHNSYSFQFEGNNLLKEQITVKNTESISSNENNISIDYSYSKNNTAISCGYNGGVETKQYIINDLGNILNYEDSSYTYEFAYDKYENIISAFENDSHFKERLKNGINYTYNNIEYDGNKIMSAQIASTNNEYPTEYVTYKYNTDGDLIELKINNHHYYGNVRIVFSYQTFNQDQYDSILALRYSDFSKYNLLSFFQIFASSQEAEFPNYGFGYYYNFVKQ